MKPLLFFPSSVSDPNSHFEHRDNGVEEATEADTHYIVKYFDSNGDEKLDYEDLM